MRWLGEATDVDEVKNILILRRGGQTIYNSAIRVSDVADVEDGLSDIRRLVRYEDKNAIALRIKKQRGTNEVEISKKIQQKLGELSKTFPPTYGYRVNVDFTKSTESTVNLTIEKLWFAALITIFICFLFATDVTN